MKSAHKLFAIVFSTALLAGCGSSHLSGNYEGTDSGLTFVLKFHGSTVDIFVDGHRSNASSGSYEIKDGKVHITTAAGEDDLVPTLYIEDNGCLGLRAGDVGTFCKTP